MQHVLRHHDGGAEYARGLAGLRLHDGEVLRRERDRAAIDDLAHACEKVLTRAGDAAADHDDRRVEHVDDGGQRS